MGNEVVCKLRYEGKTFSGKAVLETAEVIFRGERRVKIPFGSITGLEARDGELHVRTKEGPAVLELGAQAERWREKIANPKTLLEKLGVKKGESVSLHGRFPEDFVVSLKKQGSAIVQEKDSKDVSWHFLAAETGRDLQKVKSLSGALRKGAVLWIVYPKGLMTVTEHDVRGAGLKAGLTDIKVARFSDTHTALKFVTPKAKR
jgi:hypothetical protein